MNTWVFKKLLPYPSALGKIIREKVIIPENRIKLIERVREVVEQVNLDEAEVIVSGGNGLGKHPAIADTCVIGVCDQKKGEVGKALIVLKSGMSLTQEELFSFLKCRLPTLQIPVHIEFVDTIPKNSVGKVAYSIVYSLYGKQHHR